MNTSKIILSICFLYIEVMTFYTKAEDFIVDNIYYNIISQSDRTCEVTSNPNVYEGRIDIPPFVDYGPNIYKVIAIGDNAFNERSYKYGHLTEITLPNTIKRIGTSAFYCCCFSSIELPDGLEIIDNNAFGSCLNLKSITIPNSVIQIGSWTFYECLTLKEFEIMDGPDTLDIHRLALRSAGYNWSLYIGRSITNQDDSQLTTNPQILTIAEGVNVGDLMSSIDNDKLKELYIGQGVEGFPKDISPFSKLTRFHVGYPEPPICPIVTTEQYQTITVFVPSGTLNLYKNTDGWKDFINLLEDDSDSVTELDINDNNYRLYDIQGKNIKKDSRGLVIKRTSSGRTVKSYRK